MAYLYLNDFKTNSTLPHNSVITRSPHLQGHPSSPIIIYCHLILLQPPTSKIMSSILPQTIETPLRSQFQSSNSDNHLLASHLTCVIIPILLTLQTYGNFQSIITLLSCITSPIFPAVV